MHIKKVRLLDKQMKMELLKAREKEVRSSLDKHVNDPKLFWAEVNAIWKGPRKETRILLWDNDNMQVGPSG